MKKKIVVLIGMAVCILFLTSPMLASAGYSKIYGNANEDDTLDMRDVTYIKLVIFGKKPATTFADANNDGKISMLDIGQTKLIILGKEKQLTLVDQADRTVTVPRPIERIVLVGMLNSLRTLVQLDAADKIVATSTVAGSIYDDPGRSKYFSPLHRAAPELGELPRIDYRDPSLEVILTLKPDVILSYGAYSDPDAIQEGTGISTLCSGKSAGGDLSFEQHRLLGKVVERALEETSVLSSIDS
jgi:iron complex transport system substrate-binding protein